MIFNKYKILFAIIPVVVIGLSNLCLAESGLEISGIMYGNDPIAIIDDQIVKEGDAIGGFEIIEIGRGFVRFKDGAREFSQKLNKFSATSKKNQSKKDVPVFKEIKKSSQQVVEQKKKELSEVPGFHHCLNAQENFEKAEEQYEKKKFSEAFIYYKKAIQYAQWALNYRIEGHRDEMKIIVRTSEDQQRKLKEESNAEEEIVNVRYPRLKNVRKTMKWLKRNIHYKIDIEGGYWQTPEETLTLRTGDCEDFSFLAQALLKRIGIDSLVISVSYGGMFDSGGHAICVYPPQKASNYFSNYRLFTSNNHVLNMINHKYPEWKRISALNIETKERVPLLEKEFGGFKIVGIQGKQKEIDAFLKSLEKLK